MFLVHFKHDQVTERNKLRAYTGNSVVTFSVIAIRALWSTLIMGLSATGKWREEDCKLSLVTSGTVVYSHYRITDRLTAFFHYFEVVSDHSIGIPY